ncbi:hypothetical protein ONZ51_g4037 [Trametes cubensis]|uniref:DUF6534 domain-containing protein n=1 Tax=Trametes cubensis TaxID=1111947 RepID=A0AAD7TZ03_9APHY|nr:hypothetical protein ONZ51_g4037 [Trametes cubensis]
MGAASSTHGNISSCLEASKEDRNGTPPLASVYPRSGSRRFACANLGGLANDVYIGDMYGGVQAACSGQHIWGSTSGLYGLTLHQTYRYYRLYPKDRLWIKCLIALIVLLETLHTIMCIASLYYQLVTHYFDLETLTEGNMRLTRRALSGGGPHEPPVPMVFTKCINRVKLTRLSVVPSFYVYRVYQRKCLFPEEWLDMRLIASHPQVGSHYGYKLPVFMAIACMLCDLAFMIAAIVQAFLLDLDEFSHFGWLVSAIFSDRLQKVNPMTWSPMPDEPDTHHRLVRTDSTIEVLIVYAVNTGLLVGYIFDLLSFVFALILPGNLIYVSVGSVGVKLYATSVLAVLNSRRSLSARLMHDFELGSLDPRRMQADPAVGSLLDGRLDASKLQQGARNRPLTITDITFATTPLQIESCMDSTSQGG